LSSEIAEFFSLAFPGVIALRDDASILHQRPVQIKRAPTAAENLEYLLNLAQRSLTEVKRKFVYYRSHSTGEVLRWLVLAEAVLRPADRWYWDLLALARTLARAMRKARPSLFDPSLEARLMHRFLDIISPGGRRFPIPTRVEGLEILEAAAAGNEGFVCCTAHLPLVKLFIPVVRKALRPGAELVATVKYAQEDGCVDIWNDDPLPAIEIGHGVLLQTRSLLRRGGCLLMLADKEQGEYISSNIFRFVGKVHSKVIMGFPHLLDDGTVLLQIVEAPAPFCRNEVEIRANLDFIAQNVRAILAGGGPPEKVRASVMPLAQISVAEGGRDVDRIQLYSRAQLKTRAKRLEQLLSDPATQVADRALYEKRLKLMQNELDLRSQVLSRTEFGPDGRPLGPDGKPLPPKK
jgi:hypothetical protein